MELQKIHLGLFDLNLLELYTLLIIWLRTVVLVAAYKLFLYIFSRKPQPLCIGAEFEVTELLFSFLWPTELGRQFRVNVHDRTELKSHVKKDALNMKMVLQIK